jgi:putative FmdB family regulatory protein
LSSEINCFPKVGISFNRKRFALLLHLQQVGIDNLHINTYIMVKNVIIPNVEVKMPIYEFECNACQNKFDELVRASVDLTDIVCPKCGKSGPRKLMSAFGFSSGGKTVSSSSSCDCGSCHSHSCSDCH